MQEAQSANPWQAGDTAVFLRRYQLGLFLAAVQEQRQPVAPPSPKRWTPDPVRTVGTPTPTVPAASSSTASVMACIRDHESGDYAEATHPESGSGAYQFVPGTWRHWFGVWRDAVAFVGSDYQYAYEAPPLIQDAVTAYAIENGGAGNWSPRYGDDPCTVGMGG